MNVMKVIKVMKVMQVMKAMKVMKVMAHGMSSHSTRPPIFFSRILERGKSLDSGLRLWEVAVQLLY